MTRPAQAMTNDERSGAYRLLSVVLAMPPTVEGLSEIAAVTVTAGGAVPCAVQRLSAVARTTKPDEVADEYHRLFIGLGCGELTPYASHYLTGSLHDLPLVRLREDMRKMGLQQAAGIGEPEDHAATIMEAMAGLIDGSFPAGPGIERQFLTMHALSWLPRFFADLAAIEAAPFYATVGSVGSAFMTEESGRGGDPGLIRAQAKGP